MSYLDDAIGPNEELLYEAKIHWIVYAKGLGIIAIGMAMYYLIELYALIIIAAGVALLVPGLIVSYSTDLAVTTKKVIVKTGLVRRNTIEQRLGKIDSVHVDQSVMGRILGYGSITVTGSGISASPIPNISNPLGFRRALEHAEELAEERD